MKLVVITLLFAIAVITLLELSPAGDDLAVGIIGGVVAAGMVELFHRAWKEKDDQ